MSDNGSFNYNAAKDINNGLSALTAAYISAEGSKNKSMGWVRSEYSKIVPYNSPNWYHQWSRFASSLIKLDANANRPIFQNDGPVPTRPVLSEEDPVYIFDLSSNPVFPPDLPRSQPAQRSVHSVRSKTPPARTNQQCSKSQRSSRHRSEIFREKER
ncbi:hypothetical protein DFH28DRAFT_931260 [Melampsora americana]|nr:hypothetical protein DFH28DRAFT_936540 [Melampsora americana]KAH9811996.1 hypothetical protein DFH28DRAFT_931260 [Melampsora americana]